MNWISKAGGWVSPKKQLSSSFEKYIWFLIRLRRVLGDFFGFTPAFISRVTNQIAVIVAYTVQGEIKILSG